MPPNLPNTTIAIPSIQVDKNTALDLELDVLKQLENNFKSITNMIDTHLSGIKSKLENINNRLGQSRKKVDAIKDLNEALTIVSPSKFVKTFKKGQDLVFHKSSNPDFIQNFRIPILDYGEHPALNTDIELKVKSPANPEPPPKPEDHYLALLKLTKSTLKPQRTLFGSNGPQNNKIQGLGNIPRNLKYVDTLVLFNSSRNPYKHYSSFDNLASNSQIGAIKKKEKEDSKINLAEAPRTLIEGEMIQQYGVQDYRFKPTVKELPQINAPTQLAGLKGIVNVNLGNFDIDTFVPSQGGTRLRPQAPDPKNTNAKEEDFPLRRSMTVTMNSGSSGPINNMNETPEQRDFRTKSIATTNFAPTISSYAPIVTQNVNISQPQNKPQTLNPPTFAPLGNNNSSGLKPPPNLSLPPPNISLPPPNLTLPAPNIGGGLVPPNLGAGGLKPPNLSLPPPNISLTPPSTGASLKPGDPVPKDLEGLPPITDARSRLLDEIRNPNPMARLKPAKKVDRPPIAQTKAKAPVKMNHMDQLKEQIARRFAALNKDKKKRGDSSESESD